MKAEEYYKSTRLVETRNWTIQMVFSFADEYYNFKNIKTDLEKYPYNGICGKCSNYRDKLDKDCLCTQCRLFGVRKLVGEIPNEILRFVKPRF